MENAIFQISLLFAVAIYIYICDGLDEAVCFIFRVAVSEYIMLQSATSTTTTTATTSFFCCVDAIMISLVYQNSLSVPSPRAVSPHSFLYEYYKYNKMLAITTTT